MPLIYSGAIGLLTMDIKLGAIVALSNKISYKVAQDAVIRKYIATN